MAMQKNHESCERTYVPLPIILFKHWIRELKDNFKSSFFFLWQRANNISIPFLSSSLIIVPIIIIIINTDWSDENYLPAKQQNSMMSQVKCSTFAVVSIILCINCSTFYMIKFGACPCTEGMDKRSKPKGFHEAGLQKIRLKF